MISQDVINLIGLDKSISTHLEINNLSKNEFVLLNQARDFGVDSVYFNTDEEKNIFPAIFIKKVVSFDTQTLKDIAETQRKIWNYKKVLFLYVYSEVEIRIYNCSSKPILITSEEFDYDIELKKLEIKSYKFSDEENIKELNKIFSTSSIDTGVIWTLEEAYNIRKKIDLQKRVDKYLVESLVNTARQLQIKGFNINFIHQIILRSLFLLYLEDRKATDEVFYSKINKDAKSYFDILDDVDSTSKLFRKLAEHFNGNVFTLEENENLSHDLLQLIKECFISGNDNTPQEKIFKDWRLFDFSIIQIELLSEIYENFLFETDPNLKKKTGTYYTPPSLVEFILNEKLPVNNEETNYNVRVLDPSCGSGIFLVESFKRLVRRYENKHKEKLTDFNTLKKILTDNIFGIEIHPQAIKVCAFSLYLALVDNLNPKTIWQNKEHSLPHLINNPDDKLLKKQGNNLFCRDTIKDNEEIDLLEFDLVVGNPPFGTKDLSNSIKKYCTDYDFAKEMVLPFLHKATKFAPNGEIALIFNTKVLTNTGGTYQNFRKWLFNDCYVEKVYNFSILRNAPKNFGGQLFGSATGPVSIVYYKKEQPKNPSNRIIYYAPKTYIKSNVIEGLVIDSTDLKFLPREECQKSDTKIWKIAMWGGMGDFELIKRLNKVYPTINTYLDSKEIDYGVGFQLSNPSDKPNSEIKKLPIHTPNNIFKYYTYNSNNRINKDKFHRLGKIEAYQKPHILLNEGIKVISDTPTILVSFVDYKSAYSKGLVGIYSKLDDINLLKIITIYLNSDFIRYFSFLTTSSWGIERDVVKHKELFEAPYLLEKSSDKDISSILDLFDIKSSVIAENIDESKFNYIISKQLLQSEKFLIEQLLCNIDLFHKQEKSLALSSISKEQIKEYGQIISCELNDFLNGQDLFVNTTIYNIDSFSPLMMIKLSFSDYQKDIFESPEYVDKELKKLDKYLWEKKATNIYFRKKLNYKIDDDVYIIRPNQRRFWSKSMALEDASELILEILNEL
jgi:type I restriction-modification system DNA methylase subunit